MWAWLWARLLQSRVSLTRVCYGVRSGRVNYSRLDTLASLGAVYGNA